MFAISPDSHYIYRSLCKQRTILCGTELSFGRYPPEEKKKIKAINTDSDFLTFPKDTSHLLITNKTWTISRENVNACQGISFTHGVGERPGAVPLRERTWQTRVRAGGRAQNSPWQLGRVTQTPRSEMISSKSLSGDKKD